jgi:hypothetical protein
MKLAIAIAMLCALLLAGCSMTQRSSSEREWDRAACLRILDEEARIRCLRRVDTDYSYGRRAQGAHGAHPAGA